MTTISKPQVAECFKCERRGHPASECKVKQNNGNYTIICFKCDKKGGKLSESAEEIKVNITQQNMIYFARTMGSEDIGEQIPVNILLAGYHDTCSHILLK